MGKVILWVLIILVILGAIQSFGSPGAALDALLTAFGNIHLGN